MITHEDVVEKILLQVSTQLTDAIKESVTQTVRQELSSSMTKTLLQSQFYQYVNEEMRNGLKTIFKEISSASTPESTSTSTGAPPAVPVENTQELFSHTTQQIDEIMQTLLAATETIMTASEAMLALHEEADGIRASLPINAQQEAQVARLQAISGECTQHLTEIMTSLSFQDLTGQRLKKVVASIATIRETVFDLYVSTGLMMQQSGSLGDKRMEDIQQESRDAVEKIKAKPQPQAAAPSELKGPTLDASQTAVDDLLASLGL
ncbi:protein phosphatase CheZ [Desulfovibrio cuneatus]|uniref:protein phosphatase CheZ n=1 Tax=Desulfovibrio cuneatus TaxID=159728 RepID=UPI0004044845|nr:protein phosphatase CheZ [Desulfovibrio cuneatus]